MGRFKENAWTLGRSMELIEAGDARRADPPGLDETVDDASQGAELRNILVWP